jgi:hypothetical protein
MLCKPLRSAEGINVGWRHENMTMTASPGRELFKTENAGSLGRPGASYVNELYTKAPPTSGVLKSTTCERLIGATACVY